MNTIQINPADNVIVALSPLAKGTAVAVPGVGEVVAAEDIPQGHKMAVRSIAAGEDVIKYGLPIGHVTVDVQPCHLYTDPSPRDPKTSRIPSSC